MNYVDTRETALEYGYALAWQIADDEPFTRFNEVLAKGEWARNKASTWPQRWYPAFRQGFKLAFSEFGR